MPEIVGFIPGPSFVLGQADDDRPTRWCFQCRERLPHRWDLLDDPPERQPTYYEPIPVLRCSGCGEDHTDFGGFRDGPHYPESEAVCEALSASARATQADPEYAAAFSAAMAKWAAGIAPRQPAVPDTRKEPRK